MSQPESRRLALVGPGRAGLTIAGALVDAGWTLVGVAGRAPDAQSVVAAGRRFGVGPGSPTHAVAGADVVVIATPDAVIPAVAAELAPAVRPDTLVLHLSGASGPEVLDALACRTAALHPLQSLPSVELGRARLAGSGAAVAGDPQVWALAESVGLVPFAVAPESREAYHAAACIASNHLVALLAHAAACTEVPLDRFMPLVRATVDNVAALGPEAALTGPVARRDVATVRAHLEAIPNAETGPYRALAARAATLAGTDDSFTDVLR